MIKKYGDIIAGVVFLAVTAAYYQGTFMELKFKLSKYGAEFVPRIYCVILLLVSLGLIAKGVAKLLRQPAAAERPDEPLDSRAIARLILSTLAIVMYLLLLRPAGFLLATALYLAVQASVLAPSGKWKPATIFLFAVVGACSVNYLFRHVFYLALPEGVLNF